MPYKANGTEFSLQPTTGKWIDRAVKGFDGSGHPIYVATREFEIRWQLASMADVAQIQGFFDVVAATGTVVMELPQYATTPYAFLAYSGCTLSEPVSQEFFEEHGTDFVLIVHNIRT